MTNTSAWGVDHGISKVAASKKEPSFYSTEAGEARARRDQVTERSKLIGDIASGAAGTTALGAGLLANKLKKPKLQSRASAIMLPAAIAAPVISVYGGIRRNRAISADKAALEEERSRIR